MQMRFACVVLALAIPLCARSVYYLPQVIDGAVPGGSLRTTVLLANTDAATANVTITVTADDGSPRQVTFPDLGAGSRFSVTLPPGGTRILQTDGSGDGSASAATISSTAALGVSTIVSAYDSNAALLSESGASSIDANASYVIPVDTTGGLNTGIAVFNPATTVSTLTFTLFDVNGIKMGSATATLGIGGHLSRLAAGDLFPGVSDFHGTLTLGASAPVAAAAFRQNSAALSYTLLDAVPQTSLGLNFYLPQIADGPSGAATLQTTFLLYNLTANPAKVTLALALPGGAPWLVDIPGQGANSTFTVTLAPGGSAFLQTDGQGASTTGAASIRSTQPIGVAAVVTASDSNGNFVSETGMTQSPAQQKFLLAFDTTNNINTGLALFNPGSLPVTLTVNQLDSSGNIVTSAQSQPIAPGAPTTAYVSDLFPGVTGIQGALAVTATGSVGAAVSALALRQNRTPLAMASTPVSPLPLTGPGLNITSTLDSKSVATAAITPAGGALSLTDAKGNKFTLTIPANALLSTTTATMTAVTSIAGLPAGGAFNAGVQLEPDGLALFQPALLAITPASAPATGTAIPLGWHSTGQGVYLNIVQPQSSTLTMALNHFSGAGIGSGSDSYVTSQLLNIGNVLDLDQSQIGYWINKVGNDDIAGQDHSSDLKQALNIFDDAYIDVAHFMELALQSQDDNVLKCATAYALGYERGRELFGGSPEDAINGAISGFVASAASIVAQDDANRCTNTHDPLAGLALIADERTFQLSGLGQSAGSFGDLLAQLNKCSPAPMLTFNSEIVSIQARVFNSVMVTDDAKLSANVALSGTLAQDSFTGTGDGFTSFMLSGSGPLKHTKVSVTSDSQPAGTGITCSVSTTTPVDSTLTVAPNSEIKYQFTPKFSPSAVLKNGKTLAQFCPVYETKPVSATLALNPGQPKEGATLNCTGPFSSSIPIIVSWSTGWYNLHLKDLGVITGWQIPGTSSFAHKDISQSGGIGLDETFTEKTTLDLNQPQ